MVPEGLQLCRSCRDDRQLQWNDLCDEPSILLPRQGRIPADFLGKGPSYAPDAAYLDHCLECSHARFYCLRSFLRAGDCGRRPHVDLTCTCLVCAGNALPVRPAQEGAEPVSTL